MKAIPNIYLAKKVMFKYYKYHCQDKVAKPAHVIIIVDQTSPPIVAWIMPEDAGFVNESPKNYGGRYCSQEPYFYPLDAEGKGPLVTSDTSTKKWFDCLISAYWFLCKLCKILPRRF